MARRGRKAQRRWNLRTVSRQFDDPALKPAERPRWEPKPGSRYVVPQAEVRSVEALRVKHGEVAVLNARLNAVETWLMNGSRHRGDAISAFTFYRQHMCWEAGIPRLVPGSTWTSPYAQLPDDDRNVLIRWGEEIMAEWERDDCPGLQPAITKSFEHFTACERSKDANSNQGITNVA